jgi:hypothetical protein
MAAPPASSPISASKALAVKGALALRGFMNVHNANMRAPPPVSRRVLS